MYNPARCRNAQKQHKERIHTETECKGTGEGKSTFHFFCSFISFGMMEDCLQIIGGGGGYEKRKTFQGLFSEGSALGMAHFVL